MSELTPIDAIQFRMEQMGWNQSRLATLTGYPRHRISEYLHYRRKITLAFIRAYHAVAPATPLEVLIKDYPLKEQQ